MAPNAQGQIAGPLEQPGLRAGSTCRCPSLGLLGAMFLMRKGSYEAGLSLLGFLPAGWGQVFYSHLWLLDMKLLRARGETELWPLTLRKLQVSWGKRPASPETRETHCGLESVAQKKQPLMLRGGKTRVSCSLRKVEGQEQGSGKM